MPKIFSVRKHKKPRKIKHQANPAEKLNQSIQSKTMLSNTKFLNFQSLRGQQSEKKPLPETHIQPQAKVVSEKNVQDVKKPANNEMPQIQAATSKKLTTEKKTSLPNSPVIKEHFIDHTQAATSDFTNATGKNAGISAGYVATHAITKKPFMIKHSEAKLDLTTSVNEFVMGDIFKKMLFDRTPVIELVKSDGPNEPFLIRSKFIYGFTSFMDFKSDRPVEMIGLEKYLAAVLIGGESDPNPGNVGLVPVDITNQSKEFYVVKIDHGFSATMTFPTPEHMLQHINIYFNCYKNALPINKLNIEQFENALIAALQNLSPEQIELIVKKRVYELKEAGFDPSSCEFLNIFHRGSIGKDNTKAKFGKFTQEEEKQLAILKGEIDKCKQQILQCTNNTNKQKLENTLRDLNSKYFAIADKGFREIENHYITLLNKNRNTAKSLLKILHLVKKIDRPDKNGWLNSGQWLIDLKGTDIKDYAKENGFTFDGREPDEIPDYDITNVPVKNKFNNTPFLQAIVTGDKQAVMTHLSKNPDLKLANSKGDTAIILAARKGDIDLVFKLLDMGADINVKNKANQSAAQLILHATCLDCSLIKNLLNRGLNLSADNIDVMKVIWSVLKQKNIEAANLIINVKFPKAPKKLTELLIKIFDTVVESDFNEFAKLLTFDFSKVDEVLRQVLDMSVLGFAVSAKHELLIYLFNEGANVNCRNKDNVTLLEALLTEIKDNGYNPTIISENRDICTLLFNKNAELPKDPSLLVILERVYHLNRPASDNNNLHLSKT